MENKKILDIFLENIWLFDNIFWKNTWKIIYNSEYEKAKILLKQVYNYNNVDLLFPSQIDDQKLHKTLETMFRFNSNNSNNGNANNQWTN